MKKVILIAVCVGVVGLVIGLYMKISGGGEPPPKVTAVKLHKPPVDDADYARMPQDVVMAPGDYVIPGKSVTWGIRYKNPNARKVFVSGTWDGWDASIPMVKYRGIWMLDIRPLKPAFGRNDFKFMPDGKWEKGDNRSLYINEEGLVERPEDLIFSATLDTPGRISVSFKRNVKPTDNVSVRIRRNNGETIAHKNINWIKGNDSSSLTGYSVSGNIVVFRMGVDMYGLEAGQVDRVSVAGTFNNWDANAGQWQLHKTENERVWELAVSTSAFGGDFSQAKHEFKFVVNGSQWMRPSISARNAVSDGKGNTNLRLDPELSSGTVLQINLAADLPLSENYMLVIEGLGDRPAYHAIFPLPALDKFKSKKVMGATLDKAAGKTIFRIFSPRASRVELCFYAGPEFRSPESGELIKPSAVHVMKMDHNGVWEIELPEILTGTYYAFRLDGPSGAGEGFDPKSPVSDPCARAVAHARNASIVIDPDEINKWFSGWTDADYTPPALKDLLIYETHVRDLSIKESSGVAKSERGLYAGVTASLGTGTGLDHLKKLGVNMIEFMPISEFENGVFGHSWGYGPAFYAAPEASYAHEPLKGSQYHEFKSLVNKLHGEGYGVILDVVFNHVGDPNVFYAIDRKYYFRMDYELVLNNFSGCGNDLRTEAPMMRRFIVDNILYWMREHHVDGFRFDLAELIDMETLRLIEKEARALNPDVILISEPWSFRGDHKRKLKGTGWSAWNNEYRDPVKHFIAGHGDRERVMKAVVGSGELWTSRPLQSVNYLESHDDMCLTDELSNHHKKDGTHLTEDLAAKSRLGATLLFTSLGIPMLSEGQEFLRSKYGMHNTFDRGDAANALRWQERERPLARQTLDYYIGLSRLRSSSAGQAFKVKSLPLDYYRRILPNESSALGYMVNIDKRNGPASFIVLVNASEKSVDFDISFPVGKWVLIGDGTQIREAGISGRNIDVTKQNRFRQIKVPRLSAYIFVSE